MHSCLMHTSPHTQTHTHALREWHIWCHPICVTHATHNEITFLRIKEDLRRSFWEETHWAGFFLYGIKMYAFELYYYQRTVECIISLTQRQLQTILKKGIRPTVPYQQIMNGGLTSSSLLCSPLLTQVYTIDSTIHILFFIIHICFDFFLKMFLCVVYQINHTVI